MNAKWVERLICFYFINFSFEIFPTNSVFSFDVVSHAYKISDKAKYVSE